MTRPRLLRRVALLIVAAILLAGCTGLPTEGPVQTGRAVDSQDGRPDVDVQPEAPGSGAGMEAVAEGFLRAHIGTAEGFSTAREYLGGSAKRSWEPDQGILLLNTSNLSTRRVAGSRIVVSATAIGEVDRNGHLSEFASRQHRTLQLGLSRVDGEWRVTTVPKDLGLWLSVSDFTRRYDARNIYFAADRGPTPSPLIPDVRWFPEAGLATALARAVIGPPPKWMADTVRRPVPAKTRLQPSSISVSSRTRTATVTLSREALRASPQDRKALWACMLQTLNQVPGVGRVEIRVGNSLLQTSGVEGVRSLDLLGYTTADGPRGPVIIRSGNGLDWATSLSDQDRPRAGDRQGDLEELPTLSSQWSQLAADRNGREIAAVSGDRTQIGRWIGKRLTSRPSFGTDLVRPAYDRQGGLWVAGRALSASRGKEPDEDEKKSSAKDSEKGSGKSSDEADIKPQGPPTIWRIDTRQPVAQAQAEPLSAPWLGAREVRSIAVAPDGQRVALVVRDRTGRSSLLLSAVVRDRNGDVDELATPIEANPSVQNPTSVTWTDETTLGVIGGSAGSLQQQPLLVPVGGLTEALGPVSGADTIVGSSLPQDRVFVITDHTSVQHRLGRAWERFESADDLAVPAG